MYAYDDNGEITSICIVCVCPLYTHTYISYTIAYDRDGKIWLNALQRVHVSSLMKKGWGVILEGKEVGNGR